MKSTQKDKSNTNKQRLWVISELYYPEMTSTGYYLTKIAEGLSGEFDVKVVCGQPNYSARGTKAPKREVLKGVEIFRVFGTTLDKNVIPFRILNMLTLSFAVFFRCFRSFRKDDWVLVVTTPPLMPFLTGAAALVRRSKHFLLIHDCYPEVLYATGKLSERSIFSRLLEYMSTRLLKAADGVIVVGRDMKQKIASKRGESADIFVIPNWAELETVFPTPKTGNPMLLEQSLEDNLVFLYAGNIGYPNDIETFLGAAEILQEQCPSAHFIFLGEGVKKSHLENKVKTKQLKNITVLPGRPRSDQIVFLNACDVGIVSLISQMKGVSMPSRTYNIMAAGKPILALCDPGSEIAMVIDEESAGWHINPGEIKDLVNTICLIAESRETLSIYGTNARNAALEKYSLKTAIFEYTASLRQLGKIR